MENSCALFAFRRAALLALLTLASPLLHALDDWQPVTPQELKMTSADAGNADAIILYHESVSDDVRKHRNEYKRIKILTEKGESYADVELPFYSEGHFGTEIVDVKARTVSPDGKITPFSGQTFDKTIVKGHGLKAKVKAFTLPEVQVGSIIEWRYTEIWTDEYVIAPRWILQENLAQKRIKFTYTPFPLDGNREIVIAHDELADNVYHVDIGLPKGIAIKSPNPQLMQLEMTDVPAYHEEEFSPPTEMMKMRVYFYYGSNKMLKPADFWRDEGNGWNKEVEKFMGHSSAVAQAAQQAVSASDTPEQKVRKIYALVQGMKSISYQNRSFVEVLSDTRKASGFAEQVLQDKSGTHNELTRLFVALARSLNLQAYLMRVATREETFFQSTIPEWSQLNSELAIVSLAEGKEIFLDPAAPLCPFGLLEWQMTGTQGLRQKPEGKTELADTPKPAYADAMMQRIADLTLAPDGSAKGRVVLLWMGQQGLQRRMDGAQTDEAGRKKAAEDELRTLVPRTTVVTSVSLAAWDDPSQPLQAVFNVELPGYAVTTGKRLLLPSELFQSKQMFVTQERKTPVYFDFPYRVVERVRITLPPDLQVESLPQTQPVQTDFAICTIQRTAKGNLLELTRDLALGGYAFPLSVYPSLKTFFAQVHSNDEEQVILQAAAK